LLLFANSWAEAYSVVTLYMRILPVNPKKFFVDDDRTEFLRYVLEPGKREGYLPRAVPSILYANAWAGGKLSARAMAEQWSQVVGRGANLRVARAHLISDMCGMLRCKAGEIEDLLRTPKAVGGLGMEPDRAYDSPVRWYSIEEQEFKGEAWERRRVAKTNVELIPASVKQHATAVMGTRGDIYKNESVARAAAESMLEAVEGQSWNASNKERSRLQSQDVVYPDFTGGDTRYVKKPKLMLDPMFVRSAVVKLLPGGWEAVKVLISESDHDWVYVLWMAWSRNVWIDWISGANKPSTHGGWGLAAEVQAEMGRMLREEDLYTWGKVTRISLIRRSLAYEMRSRRLLVEEKQWMGC
jgi:hypothetical protein